GVAKPMGVYVTTFGTGVADDERIAKVVAGIFDFRPGAIIESLDLLRPIYSPTAAYGHFGREEKTFTWERTDRAAELGEAFAPRASATTNGSAAGGAKASAKGRGGRKAVAQV